MTWVVRTEYEVERAHSVSVPGLYGQCWLVGLQVCDHQLPSPAGTW